MKFIYILFLTLSVLSLAQAAKDPLKRKLLLASKLKAEAVLNNLAKSNETKADEALTAFEKKETEASAAALASKTNSTGTTFSITVSDDLLGDDFSEKDDTAVEEVIKTKETSLKPKPRPGLTYLGQLRQLIIQFFNLLGLSTTSITEKRKNRGMEVEESNFIDTTYYREEVKNTVGAVLGRPDCIKKAACRAGKYLKTFKGKEVFIVILEKLTPFKWTETVRLVKDSAIYNGKCDYKCLDD